MFLEVGSWHSGEDQSVHHVVDHLSFLCRLAAQILCEMLVRTLKTLKAVGRRRGDIIYTCRGYASLPSKALVARYESHGDPLAVVR